MSSRRRWQMLEAWILPLAIILGVAVLLLAPLVEAGGISIRCASCFCPLEKREVSVEFVEQGALGLGKAVDVHSCSAFEDPRKVICDKRCLGVLAATGSFEST
jgi:hypothetical protein